MRSLYLSSVDMDEMTQRTLAAAFLRLFTPVPARVISGAQFQDGDDSFSEEEYDSAPHVMAEEQMWREMLGFPSV